MVRTVLFLIITLLLVPVSVIYFDKPLLDTQWHILKVLCTIYLTIALACFVTGELTCLLFVGSSDFSEKISAEKYPEYKDYQNKVPRFVPKI